MEDCFVFRLYSPYLSSGENDGGPGSRVVSSHSGQVSCNVYCVQAVHFLIFPMLATSLSGSLEGECAAGIGYRGFNIIEGRIHPLFGLVLVAAPDDDLVLWCRDV